MRMVTGRLLLARVTYVSDNDEDDVKLSMCLCDTSGEDDVHIQDVLVHSGLAVNQPDTYRVRV